MVKNRDSTQNPDLIIYNFQPIRSVSIHSFLSFSDLALKYITSFSSPILVIDEHNNRLYSLVCLFALFFSYFQTKLPESRRSFGKLHQELFQ